MRSSEQVRKLADSIWEIVAREALYEYADLLALIEKTGERKPPAK
jgi:hypothetical protein